MALRALALGAACLLAAAGAAWTPSIVSGWNQANAEATLWQLLNGARANNGVAPLQQHGTLLDLARWRSQDMLNRNYFSHTVAGTSCQVYCWYDSNGLSYYWGGENIHWNSGQSDANSPIHAHESFMASSGHRANVLNGSFTHGAVGATAADNITFQGSVRDPRMYTQLFMHARVAAPAPPAPPAGGPPQAQPAAPVAPAALAAATPPPPTALAYRVDAPVSPRSAAGLDGVSEPLTQRAASASPATKAQVALVAGKVAPNTAAMLVQAPPPAEPGLLDALLRRLASLLPG